MGVFDDLKDSFHESDSSQDRSRNDSGGGDFDTELGNDIGNDLDTGGPGRNTQNSGGRSPERNSPQGQAREQGSPNQGRQHQSGPGRDTGNRGPQNTPNAQAGRPQEGSAKPQLSSRTQRKMDNAGLNTNSSQQGQQRGRGQNPEPVSEQRTDLEELKSQNQQIIELLKRINQSLNNGRQRH